MVNKDALKKYLSEHESDWHQVDAIAAALHFEGNPSEIRNELDKLYDVLPGSLGFEHISPGSVKVVVLRPDPDGSNRYHLASSMTPSDHATVVQAYLSAALSASGGAIAEHMDRAAQALESMRTALAEG
jgi:hypothetical protein